MAINLNYVIVKMRSSMIYDMLRIPGVWRCPHAFALSFWWILCCFCQASSYPWWDLEINWF